MHLNHATSTSTCYTFLLCRCSSHSASQPLLTPFRLLLHCGTICSTALLERNRLSALTGTQLSSFLSKSSRVKTSRFRNKEPVPYVYVPAPSYAPIILCSYYFPPPGGSLARTDIAALLHFVDDKKVHIPPITSAELSPFPVRIDILPGR